MKLKINNNFPITAPENKNALNNMFNAGILAIGQQGDSQVFKTFNASPLISTPNINVPLGALNYIDPQAIEIRTAVQVSDKITTKKKIGVWGGSKMITIKVKEFMGKLTADDGSANDTIKSTVNYSYITRGVFPYAGYWGNTDMGRTTTEAMQENLQMDDVKSLMNNMAIAQNEIFFYGVQEKQLNNVGVQMPVYGLLNDPELRAYTTASSNEAGTSTKWENKTIYEIYEDVRQAYQRLINSSGGNIVSDGLGSGRGKLQLVVSLGCLSQLQKVVGVGTVFMTAKQFITNNLPIAEEDIIGCPQFNSANSNSDVFYLIYSEEETYGETIMNVYQELIRAYPIFQRHSELSQKISSQVSGCIVRYPIFIDRVNGIGETAAYSKSIFE